MRSDDSRRSGPDSSECQQLSGDARCAPFEVIERRERGKCLVARRDIQPGELVLRDKPIVQSPYTKSLAQCLQCGRKVDGSYRCRKCGFPMCDISCANGDVHRVECLILSRENFEAEIDNVDEMDDHYACIMPLRCLALRTSDPEAWKLFSGFQSHVSLQRRLHPTVWEYHQEHCVQFIRDVLELGDQFTAEEINEAVYIMYTNSVNMELGPGHGALTGFYPVFANMNHSCVSNTKTLKLPNNVLEVRSVKRIAKGEEIFTQYVSPEKTTNTRRKMLYKKWMFWCDCDRCRDRTECNSYLGALLCPHIKCLGSSVPSNPTDEESDYECEVCGESVSAEYAANIYREAQRDLKTPDSRYDLIQHLERFLFSQRHLLHPNNSLVISVKQKLGTLYGCHPYTMERLTMPMLERKLQVCLDVLQTLDKVDPGVNRWRQSVVTEINKARIAIKLKRKVRD